MDLSTEQIVELRKGPGPLYVLPDDDDMSTDVPRRLVRDLFPKVLLCPAEYGEGL